jgi:aminocarboxymuconate-semialdehyde decarboxylase
VIIDVHAHCIPEQFREWLNQHGPSVGAHVVDSEEGRSVRFANGIQTGPQFGWDSLTDTEARLSALDTMGIDIQLLAGWIDLAGYEIEGAASLEYARAHNFALAAVQDEEPERFRTLGTVPLQDPGLAVAALKHAMIELGMAGVQIATTVNDTYLDLVDGLDDFWSAAQELGAFILLHPIRPLQGVELGRYFLDNTVGRPAETSIALSGLIMSGVFERFPGLKVCAVHGGGFVPFQAGRLDQAFHQVPGAAADRINRPPSSYLESIYVDTIVHDPETLSYLIRRLGADHILLGTDYPFPMGDQDPVGLVHSSSGISFGDVESIVGGNAERLLLETVSASSQGKP